MGAKEGNGNVDWDKDNEIGGNHTDRYQRFDKETQTDRELNKRHKQRTAYFDVDFVASF